MICPWCSGTGCGSCRGTGECAAVLRWHCPECDTTGKDREGTERENCPTCGAPVAWTEDPAAERDAFDEPDNESAGWDDYFDNDLEASYGP